MVSIKILGPGCANCRNLETTAREAAASMGIEAGIEKVTDLKEMLKYSILATPGLVINGKLVCAGRVPGRQEVLAWLARAMESA